MVIHTELHSYTIVLSIALTHTSSITLDLKFTTNPQIHINNLQILSVQHSQDSIFLNSSNKLKHSVRLSSSLHFDSATFFSLLLSLILIQKTAAKTLFLVNYLENAPLSPTALPDFFSNICYSSWLSRPFLAYHHCTYCSLGTVRKPAVVCSHLKQDKFSWNKAEKAVRSYCLIYCVGLKHFQKSPLLTEK